MGGRGGSVGGRDRWYMFVSVEGGRWLQHGQNKEQNNSTQDCRTVYVNNTHAVTLLPLSISHECLQYTKYVPCLPSLPCIAINTYMHQVPTPCCETYVLVWLKCANISKCSIGWPLPCVVLLQP